jgi:golgi-specific brefeldin A-resistance guanine nucleotide exchange factor 1
VLAYSIIMLNTDLHNKQVRVSYLSLIQVKVLVSPSQKRMSIDDYRKNLKGVNDGSDFAPEFLVRLSKLQVSSSN